jgi:FG-GAP-like repeat
MLRDSRLLSGTAVAAFLVIAGVASGYGTFRVGESHDIGAAVIYQAAVGDINGDGRGDVAAAVDADDEAENRVEVLLGKRDGSLRQPIVLMAGLNPEGIDIGRLNGDRRQDLAVANYSDDDVSIFIQRRNGTFRTPPDLEGGPGPWQLEIADLDRDGHNDIVTSNFDNVAPNDAISVHLGKREGFRPVDNYSGGQTGYGLEIGRLNGDRRPDVVNATFDEPAGPGSVDTYVTKADGSLREGNSVTIDPNSYSPLALGDFVEGKALDAVVADYSAGTITILAGDGTGDLAISLTSTPPVDGVWGIASGNLNGKGRLDLAVNRYDDQEVQVLYGRNAGGFTAGPTYPLGSTPETVATGRLGKDAGVDIVVGTDDTLDTFLNKRNP